MKVTLTFKTPDVTFGALDGLTDEQRDQAEAAFDKWLKHDEYVTIEIDIETGDARVLEAK
jgi:hypothetical protein